MIKDGKLFGKINLFDFGILLLIVALLIVGTLKFRTLDKMVDASTPGKIIYTIEVNNVRDYTVNSFQSGDKVFDSLTSVYIGDIKKVESFPAKIEDALENGDTKLLENPYKADLVLTIETPGTVTDVGYYANKSIELKVGSEKTIETKYVKTLGKVSSIEYIEGE